ncbi:MAG: sigma-54-dependent Fis family transcriptional regulator [Kangiellaceae bacterium]|nr:sigma-54-dependent Fis family transcriptional regulator [Kangiellaceae bacterium]
MMKNTVKILIVEDEQAQGQLVESIINSAGYHALWVESAEDAIKQLNTVPYDLVISDWKLKDKDGLWLLQQVKQQHTHCYFILATAYGTIEHAVEAIKSGANDYITKPFSKDTLLFAIERAAKQIYLAGQNIALKQQLSERQQLVDMVGSSKAMQKIFNQVEKLAATQATVHISGESGTGKELAARALHQLSDRSDKPFIVINCGAIPEGLAEAELFGAEKGAFTGSTATKIGKFEAAHKGTLFLDEVADLPLTMQTKLLRALQDGTITRIGANQPIQVDVRVISATHKNLHEMVTQGEFREDLLYRLNVVPITMPPLRERCEDLPALLNFFINKHASKHNIEKVNVTNQAFELLSHYHWPGNIRELGHCIERVMLLADHKNLTEDDFSFLQTNHDPIQQLKTNFQLPDKGIDWPSLEKHLYQQALDKTGNNKRQAAQLLGLSYKSFLYRIEKFLISD